tara:strand:+ start:140 stop:715 length:576 start_codon:yes stop_codon:yes gene_type:complete
MKYYTYAYLREDGTPYYVGKGTGRRIDNPHHSGLPPKNRRVFLKQNLTEEEAFKHEKYMIAIFGRKDLGTGILRNLTDGGDGKSGWKMSEETKEKIGKSNTGKRRSDEDKKKMSKSAKNRTSIHGMLGKTHTKEIREKLSKLYKGRPFPGNRHSQKGTTWWNDGQITKRSVECPGKQFVPGRIPLGPYKRR